MKRRLRIAGTAFGALLVPACASVEPDVAPPLAYQRTPSAFGGLTSAVAAKTPRVVEKFAEARGDAPLPVAPAPTTPATIPIAAAPAPSADVGPPKSAVAQAAPAPVADPPPRVASTPAANRDEPKPEPIPDAEGVIRANWPVLKGPVPANEPPTTPVLPPPPDSAPPANTDSAVRPAAPTAVPPPLPPGVIGSSTHQTHASPVDSASPASSNTPANQSIASAGDTPLLNAVRAFQQNRPDEAVEYLKSSDPVAQQALLTLLPALVRLSGAERLEQIKPDEMDVIVEQLSRVPNMLRSRASLHANNVRLCREVHNFAHVDPFPAGHPFHPGDIVYLYMELANFTCTPDPKVGYTIAMASSFELRDAAGHIVWRADPKEIPDSVSSPPQDYYRNFRLSVPSVPPGAYALTVKTIDRPTGRDVTKTVELRIGAR